MRLVDQHEPDLLFLDVRLPELSGLEVVQRMRHRPEIVFTTAYDRFAINAFELGGCSRGWTSRRCPGRSSARAWR